MVQTAEKAAAKAEVEATLEANAMVETVKPERGAGGASRKPRDEVAKYRTGTEFSLLFVASWLNSSPLLYSTFLLSQQGREAGVWHYQRMGVVKCWFNGERGYGFIKPDDGGERSSCIIHV